MSRPEKQNPPQLHYNETVRVRACVVALLEDDGMGWNGMGWGVIRSDAEAAARGPCETYGARHTCSCATTFHTPSFLPCLSS